MHRPSRPLILLTLGLGLVGLLLLLSRVGTTRSTDREAKADETDSRKPVVRIDPRPEGSRAREAVNTPSASDRNAGAEPTGPSFVFLDGRPAAGLRLYCADLPNAVWGTALVESPPQWQYTLDPSGRLPADTKLPSGATLAIRLCDRAIETVRIDAGRTRPYELSPPRRQSLVLNGGSGESGFHVEVDLQSVDIDPYSLPEGGQHFRAWNRRPHLADRSSVQIARAGDRSTLLALAHVELDEENRTVELDLPDGTYHVLPGRCSIGWWPATKDVELAGGSTAISVGTVPVTEATLPKGKDGHVLVPTSVRLIVAVLKPDGANSEGELELPFEVVGDRLRTSQWWRAPVDEQYTTYGLRVYWSDEKTTTTKIGPWQDLLGISEIGNP
jgi:hypothetical protein